MFSKLKEKIGKLWKWIKEVLMNPYMLLFYIFLYFFLKNSEAITSFVRRMFI
ncbi:MAG: hypothetical protein LBT02_01350 [Rickettsiales bacterium]|nr:hypothetical protein [Rickettsiales bacterium]